MSGLSFPLRVLRRTATDVSCNLSLTQWRVLFSHRCFGQISFAAPQVHLEEQAEAAESSLASTGAAPRAVTIPASSRSSQRNKRRRQRRSSSTSILSSRIPPLPSMNLSAQDAAVPISNSSRQVSTAFSTFLSASTDETSADSAIVLPASSQQVKVKSARSARLDNADNSLFPTPSLSSVPLPEPSPSLRHIMIFASEAAAIAGLNPHRSFLTLFDALWQRTDPDSFARIKREVQREKRRIILSEEETIQAALSTTDIPHYVKSVLPAVPSLSPPQMTKLYREIKTRISVSSVPVAMHTPALAQLCSVVNKVFGTAGEKRVINNLAEEGIVVKKNNRVFYKKLMGYAASPSSSSSTVPPTPSGRAWLLGGRVDGFIDGQLIEIKNRTRCFVSPLPMWDRCQFECYLHILDLQDGQVVEVLKEKKAGAATVEGEVGLDGSAERRKRTLLRRDDEVWQSTIQPLLQRFVDFLHAFLQDDGRMKAYIAASTDDKIALLGDIVPHSMQRLHREGRKSRKGWKGGVGLG